MCTHSFTLATLYKGVFPFLEKHNYDIHIIVGDREYTKFDPRLFGSPRISVIPMKRLPTPLDVLSLLRLIFFFFHNRFDVIHISTPKASLLGALAARMTRNGKIVFMNRRRVYEMMVGRKRRFYAGVDRLICKLSDVVVPVSQEMGQQLVQESICDPSRLRILGHGSSNGIDTERFSLSDNTLKAGRHLRAKLGIPANALVLIFLGRICKEKGVDQLVPAFQRIKDAVPNAHLIVAGPDDPRDPISPQSEEAFAADPQVHRMGFVSDPRPLYACSDVFIFPSFFEGLPNVLLEAAAMERPVVAFDVPGVRETVEEGVSGYLVPCFDNVAMADHAIRILVDTEERLRLGRQARERIMKFYRREVTWGSLLAILNDLSAAPTVESTVGTLAQPTQKVSSNLRRHIFRQFSRYAGRNESAW
jgi:glycosyltransferase involved in cell wall biosynthesis